MIDGVYFCLDLSWPSLLGRNIAQAALEEARVRASLDQAFLCIAWALEQRVVELESVEMPVDARILSDIADTLRRVKVLGIGRVVGFDDEEHAEP